MSETLDLFGGDLSPAPVVASSWHGQQFDPDNASLFEGEPYHPRLGPAPLIEISVQGIEHKSPEQLAHLATLALAVANEVCPAAKRGHSINPALLAFVAQARHHGHTDPALTPISVDSAGRRLFDEVEVTRFANELLRGVRSDRPAMTPERWAEAIQKVRGVRS